jgi:hypothetical protein
MPASHLHLTWLGRDVIPGPADPTYPNGTSLDLALDAADTCWTPLPYPAPGVGAHMIACSICGLGVACGATGRADDPRTIRLPCRHRRPTAHAA